MSASIPANNPADVAAFTVKNKGLLTLAVMGSTIIQILDSTIANVAIPHMQTSLGATRDTVTWVLTSYIIASAVAIPVTGWLADRIGSRRLFLYSVTGFILASMLCGIASNLTQMVVFRLLQGISGAFIGPLSQTVLLDINKPSRQQKAMAMWGMGIMVAPIVGPMIGGWLTETYNWRWCFYINLPIGIPTLIIMWWLLPSRPINRRSLDIFGFSMLALGLASLQLMLDRGAQEGWLESWEIRIEIIVILSAFWMFGIHQWRTAKPMFDRSLFKDRNFITALNFMVLIGMMMLGMFALLPPMLQGLFGYSVFDTGILLAPRGVGILVSMFIASRLAGKVDARMIVAVGFAITAGSVWQMTQWSLNMDWHPVVITGFLQGLGMGFVFIPMNGIAFTTLSPKFRTDGSSLLYLFRNLGGSIGISLMTTLLGVNIQTAHQEMAGHITDYSLPNVDTTLVDRLGPYGEAAMRVLDGEINRQAAMIAYLDDFKALMIAILCFMPLVLLLKTAKPSSGPPPPVGE